MAVKTRELNIQKVRAFNRFYTRQIGVLNESILESPFTLAEARVLFEVFLFGERRATDLCNDLSMDPAQISRIIQRLKSYELLDVSPSADDARARSITLTDLGKKAAETLDLKSNADIENMLTTLGTPDQTSLINAMGMISSLLEPGISSAQVKLRNHQIGELGWLVHRQALLYHAEFGWNGAFETLIAKLYHDFGMTQQDPAKGLWVADIDGAIAGSVYVLPAEDQVGTAQLRMLYVEPFARGKGVGGKLVKRAVSFARKSGYDRLILWTQSCLTDARRVYERAGFTQISEEPHHAFGKDLVGQYLELKL